MRDPESRDDVPELGEEWLTDREIENRNNRRSTEVGQRKRIGQLGGVQPDPHINVDPTAPQAERQANQETREPAEPNLVHDDSDDE